MDYLDSVLSLVGTAAQTYSSLKTAEANKDASVAAAAATAEARLAAANAPVAGSTSSGGMLSSIPTWAKVAAGVAVAAGLVLLLRRK